MEHNTDLIHAAYFKHAYTHALAHCESQTQASSILVSRDAGILMASSLIDEGWYSISAVQSIIYKAALRGVSCYGLDLYCPSSPSKDDAIAIRESGVSTFVYHKEFADKKSTHDQYAIDFLDANNVRVIEWSGKVSNKPLNLLVLGESFNP